MTKHPAVYSPAILEEFQRIIEIIRETMQVEAPIILDGFAGTGKIHELLNCETWGIEIEPEWSTMHPQTIRGDATRLPVSWTNHFHAYMTSSTYGNRMADSHTVGPEDKSKRITYTHVLGHKLHPNNSGGMQWGNKYRELHEIAWREAYRVVRPGGFFVLNIRDHFRAGEVQPVTQWHAFTLVDIGFEYVLQRQIKTPGMRYGANSRLRMDYENVLVFRVPNPKEVR